MMRMIYVNEALLQGSDESKIMPRATAPSLALALFRALYTTSAVHCQPNPLPLTNCLCQTLPVGLRCQKRMPKTPPWLYRN